MALMVNNGKRIENCMWTMCLIDDGKLDRRGILCRRAEEIMHDLLPSGHAGGKFVLRKDQETQTHSRKASLEPLDCSLMS